MKIKTNYNNDDLWCNYCKEKIETNEKYIEIEEEDLDGVYYKTYHYDCFRLVADEYEDEIEDYE